MAENSRRIRWTPGHRSDELVRLYESDAAGMRDEGLLVPGSSRSAG